MDTDRGISRHDGFMLIVATTLVLLIAARVLGVGLTPPRNDGGNDPALVAKAKADIKAWEINLIRYKTWQKGAPPTQAQGLEIMTVPQPKAGRPALAKPEALKDPWGHKYQYRIPGKHNPNGYDVFSLGPDGVEGTTDDIGNW